MELNVGQKAALTSMYDFLVSDDERYMRLIGPAGTGKTTVINFFLKQMAQQDKIRLGLNLPISKRQLLFCATTNKAAEAFEAALGREVKTIHSTLRLVMQEDPKSLKDVLVSSRPHEHLYDSLIFVDEASYVDMELLLHIESKLDNSCKVIFMGDSAQCKATKAGIGVNEYLTDEMVQLFIDKYKITDMGLPVFMSEMREAELTQIMRQADGNPIQAVSTSLRQTVITQGKMPPANVDGKHIIWLPRDQFDALMLKDMTSGNWDYHTSKYLAYTNKRVNLYNKRIYSHLHNTPTLKPGEYAVNNEYVAGNKQCPSIGTDRLVYIKDVVEGNSCGVPGHYVRTDRNAAGTFDAKTGNPLQAYFMPEDRTMKDKRLNALRRRLTESNLTPGQELFDLRSEHDLIKSTWVDFRPVFGCTVYKSQGSTFRRVYLDLGDINMCYDYDQKLRMLYVGFSRAQMQVFMTGDVT